MAIEIKDRTPGAPVGGVLSPDFTVSLMRELSDLLSSLTHNASGVGVSGERPLARIFGPEIADFRGSYTEAAKRESIPVGNFRAWPVFITDGWRSVEAAVFNSKGLEATFPEFFPNSSSHIRGGIGEAVRNIGQHGHRQRGVFMVGSQDATFAPGGVFVQALQYRTSDGRIHPVLLAVIADEGEGLGSPSLALVDGSGDSTRGSQYEGLGIELRSSLAYIVKARSGEWHLFESGIEPTLRDGQRVIEPRCALRLPPVERGCQKILFFTPPLPDDMALDPQTVRQKSLDDEALRREILRSLATLLV